MAVDMGTLCQLDWNWNEREQVYEAQVVPIEPELIELVTKGSTMSNRKSVIESEIARLQAELHALNSRPKEPGLYATVMFTKYGNYTYAALRTNQQAGQKGWYLTGKEQGARTWDELLDFAGPDAVAAMMVNRLVNAKYLSEQDLPF